MKEKVILVNEQDQVIGSMDKMEAHVKGELHRAFSVFLFNSKGEMLLQKRASTKYHSPGLWTNACCSHPRMNESTLEAANRRLMEEIGIRCELDYLFHFIYKVKLDKRLFEHELDHVFIGQFDGIPQLNPKETDAFKWMSVARVQREIELFPDHFTAWFKIIMAEYVDRIHAYHTLIA